MSYKNKETRRKTRRRWLKEHPGLIYGYKDQKAYRERQKIYKQNNKAKIRENQLKYKYGITQEQYDEKVVEQSNLCAICGCFETRINQNTGEIRNLVVDHNHKTLKIRGLLCGLCNRSIGLFNENIELFEKAIQYLKKYEGSNG